jgi:DNA-directed RNA polymerase subunit RPC12/RpoP
MLGLHDDLKQDTARRLLDKAKSRVGGSSYDFYRCFDCGRLISFVEERRAYDPKGKNYGRICPCGSRRYRPANLPWWGWFLPRVWVAAYVKLRTR